MDSFMVGDRQTRVLIVDGQPIFRLGLLTFLESAFPHWKIAEADSVRNGSRHLWEGAVDLLFIDSYLLGQERLQGPTSVSCLSLVSCIVAIIPNNDPIMTTGCLGAGAHFAFARTDPPSRILSTVDIFAARCDHEPGKETDASSASVPATEPEILKLTVRQFDVLRLLATGQSNKVIARDLGLSVSTVKVHLNTVFRALGARNRVEAVVRARPFQDSIPSGSATDLDKPAELTGRREHG